MAGFPWGSWRPLAASAVSFEAGLGLVIRRGALMQEAAERAESAMAAVVGMAPDALEAPAGIISRSTRKLQRPRPDRCLRRQGRRWTPSQGAAVKAAGGPGHPLRVKGRLPLPSMAAAARGFAADLTAVEFASPAVPLYSDCTGLPTKGISPRCCKSRL